MHVQVINSLFLETRGLSKNLEGYMFFYHREIVGWTSGFSEIME